MPIDAWACINVFVDVIVDIRLGRHEMFLNILEVIRGRNKIYRHQLRCLYISAGNDVIGYVRSAANRTNVLIWGHVRVAITVQPISKTFTLLERLIQALHCFLLCKP